VSASTAITPARAIRGRQEGGPAEPTPLLLAVEEVSLHAIAERVADLLEERRDDGFLDIDSAAAFLGGSTKKRIYHLVERGRIRVHRVGGRLLFDPAELREDVERGE
jgi:hypothetical protein